MMVPATQERIQGQNVLLIAVPRHRIPLIKSSGFGVSLELGSKAIGFILLALRCIALTLLISQYSYMSGQSGTKDTKDFSEIIKIGDGYEKFDTGIYGKFPSAMDRDIKTSTDTEIKRMAFMVYKIEIGALLILSIFDVIMLIGVFMRRTPLIYPWIVVQVIAIALAFLQLPLILFIRMMNGTVIGSLLAHLIFVVFSIYFLLVVNSHHHDLKKGATSSNSIS